MDFPLYFQNVIRLGHPNICLSGSMPEAQIKRCPVTPPPSQRAFEKGGGPE